MNDLEKEQLKQVLEVLKQLRIELQQAFDDDRSKLVRKAQHTLVQAIAQTQELRDLRNEDAGFFKVTSTCKADLKDAFKGDKKALKRINELTHTDMNFLAEQLAEDYCNQLYWDSLKTIFEERFLKEEK